MRGGWGTLFSLPNPNTIDIRSTLKVLHITASYKPAFIYGGPIYSVAALCEAIAAEGLRFKAEGGEKVKSQNSKVERDLVSEENLSFTEELQRSADCGEKDESTKSKVEGGLGYDEILLANENLPRISNSGLRASSIQVYTTLANGKQELPYLDGHTEIVEGVAVTYFKRITKDHSHFSPALLTHLWRNVRKFDVVHIHSWWNLVSMGAVIVCLLRGIRPILSPRGMLGDYTLSKPKAFFHRYLGRYLLKKCDFHATTTMEAKEILRQVFNGDDDVEVVDSMEGEVQSEKFKVEIGKFKVESGKWEVGSRKSKEQGTNNKEQGENRRLNGAPSPSKRAGGRLFIIHNLVKLPEQLPTKTRGFDGTLHLIFLSRIHHKKGIELLLDALVLVDFPFKLSIVGEGEFGYVESLKSKVEGLKLTDYVEWVGAVYGEEKYRLLAKHDAFILPSYNENFANVVIEAISVGTPVLLSEHVGLQDYVRDHHFGLVFRLDELKSCLDEAYQMISEGKLMIDAKVMISNKVLVIRYLEMYDNVL